MTKPSVLFAYGASSSSGGVHVQRIRNHAVHGGRVPDTGCMEVGPRPPVAWDSRLMAHGGRPPDADCMEAGSLTPIARRPRLGPRLHELGLDVDEIIAEAERIVGGDPPGR